MKSKRQTKTKTKTKTPDLEQQQQQPPVQNDETDVGNEYDEMYGEDYEDYEEEVLEKPKLAEGFYEIEAVRKKRVRKVYFGLSFSCFFVFYVLLFHMFGLILFFCCVCDK